MVNKVSDTGFWIENDDIQHSFSQTLFNFIKTYAEDNSISTVYDFGCGTGEYLDKLTKALPGVSATGFEGYQTNVLFNNVVAQDLSKPFTLTPADLSISIEVGEHIPKEFESIFIDNVSNNTSKHLILSWAIVGQGGLGHINCQNNDYVIEQFSKRGWVYDEAQSQKARAGHIDQAWLGNTVMVFTRLSI
jgi:cyclopropane fatty-acyl-phospholipid synthase-like methyltransferase